MQLQNVKMVIRVDKIIKYFKQYDLDSNHTFITSSAKKRILKKYNYTCAGTVPGKPCIYNDRKALQIDHIVPQSIMCVHNKYNLQVLCANCHSLKTYHYDNDLIRKFKAGEMKLKHLVNHIKLFC